MRRSFLWVLLLGAALWFGCSDTEAPYVTITNPIHGSLVSGTVTVSAIAMDNKGIDSVNFYIDDSLVSSVQVEPYRHIWDTAGLLDSSFHSIYAEAFDAAGNSDVSATITVCIGSC